MIYNNLSLSIVQMKILKKSWEYDFIYTRLGLIISENLKSYYFILNNFNIASFKVN